jgi:hypothetical protein
MQNNLMFFSYKKLSDSIPDRYWKKLLSNVRLSARNGSAGGRFQTALTIAGRARRSKGGTWPGIVEIDIEDLKEQFDKQEGKCFWLGGLLDFNEIDITNSPFAPSVDRLDNSIYYVKNNIVISSRFANRGKGAYQEEDFAEKLKKLVIK